MVGSGVFLLPAAIAPLGSISIIGWLCATAGALFVALGLGRLAQLAPLPGGPCAHARLGLGRYFGFQSYLLFLLSYSLGNLPGAVASVSYIGKYLPGITPGWIGTGAVVAVYALFTALNALGARRASQFGSIALVAGLLPIALVCTLGWWKFDPALFRASWNPSGQPLGTVLPQSVLLVFWAFTGLESASIVTAVVERPERNVALATVGGVLLAGGVYIVSSAVIFGLLPAQALANSLAPFADAAQLLLGRAAGGLVAAAALVKTLGSLAGCILVAAQSGQAAAVEGYLPRPLAAIDRRGIPMAALLATSGVACLAAVLTHSSTLARQFEFLISLTVLMLMLVYGYALLSLWIEPRLRAAAGRGYRACAIAGIAFCAGVLAGSGARLLWQLALLLALTVPAYLLWARRATA